MDFEHIKLDQAGLYSNVSFGGGGSSSGGSNNAISKSPTYTCQTCGAPHGGVYSPTTCHNCYNK